MLATIPIDQIDNGQRLRDVSEATVEALVNSIADIGLLNPVTVYRKKVLRNGWVDGYGLVAGLHRKTACERLGLVEIEANVLDLTDLECQIAECDENLCAPQLTSAERARFTKRRKEAYEALHPETRHGGDKPSRQLGDFENDSTTKRFTADTAAATGQSERAVQRDAERGDKIADAALDLLRGTVLDTGVYLDKLKKLPVTEQIKAIKSDLAAAKQKADRDRARKDKRKLADRPLDDAAVLENQVAALVAAWNKASAEAREEFMLRVGIETGTEPAPQVEVPSGEAAVASSALPAVIPSESNEGQNLSEGGADAEDGVASRPSASGGESAVGGDDMRIAVPAPAIQPGTATRSLDDLAVQDGLKMSSDGKPATGLYSEGMNAGSDKGVTGGESAATPDTRTSIQRTMDEVNAARAKAEDVPTLIRGWTSKQPRPAICLDHSCDSYGPDGFMPCHDCLRVARAA